VERRAECRREHFVRGVSIKELARRTGLSRNTVRAALRSAEQPVYRRAASASKLDPFKDEIHRLLAEEPKLTGVRVRELIEPLRFDGGKTIVDDYLREVRRLFASPPRAFQRTVYPLGEICQPAAEIPVGHGQTRRGWVVVSCLGYSRAGAGALVFSKETPDLLWGIGRCLRSLGALPAGLGLGSPGRVARARGAPDRAISPPSAAS
jgi:transposase